MSGVDDALIKSFLWGKAFADDSGWTFRDVIERGLDYHGHEGMAEPEEFAARLVTAMREVDLWQDISTAPKDGTTVLVYVPSHHRVTEAWFCEATGLWPRDEAYSEEGEPCNVGMPSHWQPLPATPTEGVPK